LFDINCPKQLKLVTLGLAIPSMIVIPKATVLVLVLMCLLFGIKRQFNPIDRTIFLISILLGVLVVWQLITLILCTDDLGSIGHIAKIGGLFIAGLMVWNIFSFEGNSQSSTSRDNIIILGVSSGVAIIIFAAVYIDYTGEALWSSYYGDPFTTLSNSAVVIGLSVWSLVAVLSRRSIVLVAIVLVFVFGLLCFLSSLAAILSVLIGVAVLLARRLGKRRGGILIAVLAASFVIVSPYLVKHSPVDGTELFASHDEQSVVPRSVYHRLAMWSFVQERIEEKPWLGWGFSSSRSLPQEGRRLVPNMEIMPLHPHNIALQARLELGLPGALILAGLVFAVFYRLATFTDDGWRSGIAMAPAAAWLFVANVSYGMWQSWWIALAFLIAVIMKVAMADEAHAENIPG